MEQVTVSWSIWVLWCPVSHPSLVQHDQFKVIYTQLMRRYDEEQAMAEAKLAQAAAAATGMSSTRSRSRSTDASMSTNKTSRVMSWK